MKIQESGENYLETILRLKNRQGNVRSIDLVVELNYSKPSISRAVGLLKKAGYLTVDDNGYIELTAAGLEKANSVYEKHRIIKSFLVKVLGVNDETAENDACRIEHIISDESFGAIKNQVKKLGDKD